MTLDYLATAAAILERLPKPESQRVRPAPAATGLRGAAAYVGFSVRHFKSMVRAGRMPPGRATGTRSYVWLYAELEAALCALPAQNLAAGEPPRLAAGKAAAKMRHGSGRGGGHDHGGPEPTFTARLSPQRGGKGGSHA